MHIYCSVQMNCKLCIVHTYRTCGFSFFVQVKNMRVPINRIITRDIFY